jgi:hypothetical protein
MHVAPLFIAETSPDNLRGKLVSYKEAAIVGNYIFTLTITIPFSIYLVCTL